ncbi:MAG: pentapeptide repeat-containing protein, partial [Anaerolineae bacterium]
RAARLDGALLSRVVLHGADLTRASLLGAAILPDGTGLPPSDDGADWRTPFEAWAQSARLDEHGQVI